MRTALRVKQETTTTGTGNLTLAAAPTGFRRFMDEFEVAGAVAAKDWICYVAETSDGSEWEWGAAQILDDAGNGELKRSTAKIFESSNADALVNFSAGTKTVRCITPPDLRQLPTDYGGQIYQFATGSNIAAASFTNLTFSSESWDSENTITTPEDFIDIPVWADRVEVACEIYISQTTPDDRHVSATFQGFGLKHEDPQSTGQETLHTFALPEYNAAGNLRGGFRHEYDIDRSYSSYGGGWGGRIKIRNPHATNTMNLLDNSWFMIRVIR